MGVAHAREIGQRPRRLAFERLPVRGAAEYMKVLGAVQRQVAPPAVLRAIAAGPAKARDAGALGHVFAVVPLVEVFFVRGVDVRPDEQFAHGVAVVPDWCCHVFLHRAAWMGRHGG
ncbi:Uncharacterised protein [Bordetella pertussis]|nr:Uncharacterised protein [Bordetella pertussis]